MSARLARRSSWVRNRGALRLGCGVACALWLARAAWAQEEAAAPPPASTEAPAPTDAPAPTEAPVPVDTPPPAPSGPALLTGTVLQPSGAPLVGVYIAAQRQGVAVPPLEVNTEELGRYQLELPAGEYEIQFLFDDMEKEVRRLRVGPGERVTLPPISLRQAKPQRIVVVRERARGSQAAANEQRQQAVAVSDVVSGEEIKKAADSSASQAAARVVGATVVGDRFVYVRGLGERYANALFNGAPLPSPEPDQQAVPFDVFPASLLANLTIAKTATADIPGDFAGGSVQINTQDFPARLQWNASISLGANLQTVFQPMLTYRGGALDWLGFDDGTRAAPQRVPGQSSNDFYRRFNNIWSAQQGTGTPNYGLAFSVGGQRLLGKRRLGYLAALTYSADAQTREEEVRTFYLTQAMDRSPTLLATTEYDNGAFASGGPRKTWRSTYGVQWGALTNLNLQVSDSSRVAFTALFTQSADKEARVYQGYSLSQDRDVSYSRLRFLARSMLFTQLSGSHLTAPKLGSGNLDWSATYAYAARAEPDTREVAYLRDTAGGDFRLANSGVSGQRFFSDNGEHQLYAALDYNQAFKAFGGQAARFKVGAAARGRFREFSASRYRFGFNGVRDLDPRLPAEELLGPAQIDANIDVREQTNAYDKYSGRMGVYAAYALVDLPLLPRLRATAGLRLEVTQQRLTASDPMRSDLQITVPLDSYDPLPSLNLAYKLTSAMNLRGAVSMTVARPEFRELAPFQFADFFGGELVQGNLNLRRTRIVNADLRWEWFLGEVDLLAASVFYKYFDGPIESTVTGGSDIIRSFANADSAYTLGAELEARKELRFHERGVKGLTLGGNLTLIRSRVDLTNTPGAQTDSERPMQGQSPFVLNAFAEYERPSSGTQARLLYNVYGERIDAVGSYGQPNRYEQPRHQLDLSVSQRLPRGFSLRLAAKNLLNWPVQIFQRGHVKQVDATGVVEGDVSGVTYRYRPGVTLNLTLAYSH